MRGERRASVSETWEWMERALLNDRKEKGKERSVGRAGKERRIDAEEKEGLLL